MFFSIIPITESYHSRTGEAFNNLIKPSHYTHKEDGVTKLLMVKIICLITGRYKLRIQGLISKLKMNLWST